MTTAAANNVKTGLAFIIIGIIALSFFVATAGAASPRAREMSLVQSTCSYSREVTSGTWEDLCGEMQDKTNTEFLCSDLSSDAYCWVEDKNAKK